MPKFEHLCLANQPVELPLVRVPHFCDGANEYWYRDFERWLYPHGLAPLMVNPEGCPSLDDTYSIASGPAERGHMHSVVACCLDIVHDPHPSRAGLIEVKDYIFFVKINPAL